MTTTSTTTARANTYAGTCTRCHTPVAAGAGLLGGRVDGRWTVTHRDGDCRARTTADMTPAERGMAVIAPRRATYYAGRSTSRRSCPTGGNCSSFGSGRSCAADDCDGY